MMLCCRRSFSSRSNIMDGILTRWTNQETAILRQEYDDIEPILINRCTMMRLACDDQPHSELMHNGLVQSLVTLVTAARKAGRYQVSQFLPCFISQYKFISIISFGY